MTKALKQKSHRRKWLWWLIVPLLLGGLSPWLVPYLGWIINYEAGRTWDPDRPPKYFISGLMEVTEHAPNGKPLQQTTMAAMLDAPLTPGNHTIWGAGLAASWKLAM